MEPSADDAYKILKGLKSRFEEHHGLRYTDKALRVATDLASRYINDRFLPDKAIDVIDEAGAFQQLLPASRRKKVIGVSEIEAVIAKIARIPPKAVSSNDKETLQKLEKNLQMVVFGQDQAITSLATSIKLARAGLRAGEKPIGSFLLAGPTGVGKTEVTRQLARLLGLELIRFDMSEYMERHTVSRLIGAPPGYVGFDQGGLLTDAVTQHPHAVVLLDEIEKAHPDVFNLLLQVMDHGTLTDNNGRKADFRHVILVMTTNAGAESISRRTIGFTSQDHSTDGLEAINRMFTPEFRNRLDSIVQFQPLAEDVILTVVDKFLTELQAQLDDKRVTLDVDVDARLWLVEKGYDIHMGARPMERVIQEHIKKPLAELVLFGALSQSGGTALVRLNSVENRLEVTVSEEEAELQDS
jgi:ATP-dependent Clp protease ATP-binding subunit ClpA